MLDQNQICLYTVKEIASKMKEISLYTGIYMYISEHLFCTLKIFLNEIIKPKI